MTETIVLEAPLTGDATAENITASAQRHCQAAADAAERGEQHQAEADAVMAAARERAERIIAEAQAQARPLAEAASAARRASQSLAETGQRLDNAAVWASKAEEAEAHVRALEAERDELAEKLADIAARLAPLQAERRELEGQLASATEAADLDAMTALRNRIDSIRAAEAALTGQAAQARTRLDAIGDGQPTHAGAEKELAAARRAGHRGTAREALNWALPDRPEAVAAKERDHRRELDRLRSERYAEERHAAEIAKAGRQAVIRS